MKHYIIVKYNSLVLDKDKLFSDISALFYRAKVICGVHDVAVYRSSVDLANRYDLMVVVHMEKEALSLFDSSDIHKEWKSNYSHIIETKAIFDCE